MKILMESESGNGGEVFLQSNKFLEREIKLRIKKPYYIYVPFEGDGNGEKEESSSSLSVENEHKSVHSNIKCKLC